jgi:hypothetical protein
MALVSSVMFELIVLIYRIAGVHIFDEVLVEQARTLKYSASFLTRLYLLKIMNQPVGILCHTGRQRSPLLAATATELHRRAGYSHAPAQTGY